MQSTDALRVGDSIYGTETTSGVRRLRKTRVLAHWKTEKLAFRITLADGMKLVAYPPAIMAALLDEAKKHGLGSTAHLEQRGVAQERPLLAERADRRVQRRRALGDRRLQRLGVARDRLERVGLAREAAGELLGDRPGRGPRPLLFLEAVVDVRAQKHGAARETYDEAETSERAPTPGAPIAWKPPSTWTISPVIRRDRSDSRNSTVSATAAGSFESVGLEPADQRVANHRQRKHQQARQIAPLAHPPLLPSALGRFPAHRAFSIHRL